MPSLDSHNTVLPTCTQCFEKAEGRAGCTYPPLQAKPVPGSTAGQSQVTSWTAATRRTTASQNLIRFWGACWIVGKVLVVLQQSLRSVLSVRGRSCLDFGTESCAVSRCHVSWAAAVPARGHDARYRALQLHVSGICRNLL